MKESFENPKIETPQVDKAEYQASEKRDRSITAIPGILWREYRRNQKSLVGEKNEIDKVKVSHGDKESTLEARMLELYALSQEYAMEPSTKMAIERSADINEIADVLSLPEDQYLLALQSVFNKTEDNEIEGSLDEDDKDVSSEDELRHASLERRKGIRDSILRLMSDTELLVRYKSEVESEKKIRHSKKTKTKLYEVLDARALGDRFESERRRLRVGEFLAREKTNGSYRQKSPGRTPQAMQALDKGIELAQKKEKDAIGQLSLSERGLLATENLLKGKNELETKGFVMTESRKNLISEISDLAAQGFRVFLGGPTGSGKTSIALFALKEVAPNSYSWVTWTSETNVRDLFGSPKLSITKDGAESGMTKGPVTHAVIGEKQGILHEEITAGTTNVQMSMKTLWASKPGDTINLPGFNGTEFTKANIIELATGNLKGKRHEERETMDPAVAREFKAIEVPFMPANEMRDIILMRLIDRTGVMPISKKDVDMVEQFCKVAELSQMAYLEEIPDEIKKSDLYKIISPTGEDMYLTKVFLDTGTVSDLFIGWRASGRSLSAYLQDGLRRFIDNNPHFHEAETEKMVMKNILKAFGFNLNASMPDNFFASDSRNAESRRSYLLPSELGFLIPGEPPSDEDEFAPENEQTDSILGDIDENISNIEDYIKKRKEKPKADNDTSRSKISVKYKISDEDGVEKQEPINIDIKEKIVSSLDFYEKLKIDIPNKNKFLEKIDEIWTKNYDEIKSEMEQNGFDEVLLIPGGLNISQLHTQMTEGYNATYKGSGFTTGGSFEGVIEGDNDTRIVLVHKNKAQNLQDRSELKGTLGKKIEEFVKSNGGLSLSDYLIYQRQYFEDNGSHLDEIGWTALPGSKVPNPNGGFRVVCACWRPDGGGLDVDADAPGSSYPHLGCRPSRSFF